MGCKSLTSAIVGGALTIAFLQPIRPVVAQTEAALQGLSRFDRVAAMTSAHESDRKRSTAFFVAREGKVVLVTTKHSALETNVSTELALPSTGKELRIFRLVNAILKPGEDPWHAHPSADVALCELKLSKLNEGLRSQIEAMAFALDDFELKVPTRSSRVEVIGFPLGLGLTQERISPLVTNCFVASEPLLSDGTWGRELVYFVSPPVGGGTSGGIVTLHEDDEARCKIVGMCVGFNADGSGAKLARLVPTEVVMEFVETFLK